MKHIRIQFYILCMLVLNCIYDPEATTYMNVHGYLRTGYGPEVFESEGVK
jgi:hypothetical protein